MAKIDTHCYDQKGWKTIPFGAAHTYIAHIREYPPGLPATYPFAFDSVFPRLIVSLFCGQFILKFSLLDTTDGIR